MTKHEERCIEEIIRLKKVLRSTPWWRLRMKSEIRDDIRHIKMEIWAVRRMNMNYDRKIDLG